MADEWSLTLTGHFYFTQTCGKFAAFMDEHRDVFRKHFGVELVSGSLNVIITGEAELPKRLDAGEPQPAFRVPAGELRPTSRYLIGAAAHAWRAELSSARIVPPHSCWVFRRIGSKVKPGVLEILSTIHVRETYRVQDGENLTLALFAGPT